ncbi:hypothetical protein [Tenacibaculum piscium]|uniref:Glutaminyl-tRNA synthetase n=2 Tax=Tenacibaculum piscium TaxID=1458515 RepID=A0A2H1YFN4_9FLAO|nr:hypothetical protein [Tenacibaculum piscium]MBE7629080.1 hypothetical protein [Tenacibaculum piscium]MBE7670523.1 hypothetical protein [Tenacibaculum piscium]MBE7684899.1 hypothetical protein [Tenacibaculum piscium]MBE7689602.1 hypothetical protein [Tenacibaculum piscium]MCG8183468.1 hypothetical protein [Tenacibaculum piscium]
MKKVYNNNREVARDLKKLKLKRDISFEEIKLVKKQFKDDVSLSKWVQSFVQILSKLSAYNIAKKIIK